MALINKNNNYIKIKSYNFNYEDDIIFVLMEVYENKDIRIKPTDFDKFLYENILIKKEDFNIEKIYDSFDDTMITNLYLYIKNLDEYSDCEDDL